ncbi:cytidylyltransferase domain-containing protein [Treponema maltophilum]|uniref:cytidylyltransferase domain-containing protein n=1 Tax=Treponema maltophilum TaxID=51160 RepID=UPI003D902970
MTAIIVQCRLSSTRLPSKALLPLGSCAEPLVVWTMRAMKNVRADSYWLACDEASFSALNPLAEQNGWNCFAGPAEDVLKRFCLAAQKAKADIIVRATADNPFLFYEAAQASVEEFVRQNCDYFTYTGLPHGSGVEVISAQALFRADLQTSALGGDDADAAFEREHVGPALYKHPERFRCLMQSAPSEWNHPGLRTTVDTAADYRNACRLCRLLERFPAENPAAAIRPPYGSRDIINALQTEALCRPVLLVPAVKEGRGTGHFRRCLSVTSDTKLVCDILMRSEPSSAVRTLLDDALNRKTVAPEQIRSFLPEKGEYALVVADSFYLEENEIAELRTLAPLAALDEGSPYTDGIDFLADLIPPLDSQRCVNAFAPYLLPLPEKRPPRDSVRRILVCLGGEDPANLSLRAALAFADAAKTIGARVSAVLPDERDARAAERKGVEVLPRIDNLQANIGSYDLVVTHYGFTAFEAALSGCALVLLATSPLHAKLSKKYGCVCLSAKALTASKIKKLLAQSSRLIPEKLRSVLSSGSSGDLASFILRLAGGKNYACPICGTNSAVNPVIARDGVKTIRACKKCGMFYIASLFAEKKEYGQSYFFDEYKAQYGKTYLEDFESIKKQGLRRMGYIRALVTAAIPNVLDIGCAYGAFLSAASEFDFRPFGIDICESAVAYVRERLGFPAVSSAFPDFTPDFGSEFSIPAQGGFDAVTMWYVIEHFADLHSVLLKVSELVKKGGVFAFSTPCASGISARFSKKSFFKNSPSDHFTLWRIRNCRSVLKKYGFKVRKIVSTGHHPERFPYIKLKQNNRLASALSRLFRLGDTFEVYCTKIR